MKLCQSEKGLGTLAHSAVLPGAHEQMRPPGRVCRMKGCDMARGFSITSLNPHAQLSYNKGGFCLLEALSSVQKSCLIGKSNNEPSKKAC